MAHDWTRDEVEAIVGDYFDMLRKDLSGDAHSKRRHTGSAFRRTFKNVLTVQ